MIFKRQKTLLTKKQAREMAKALRKALEEVGSVTVVPIPSVPKLEPGAVVAKETKQEKPTADKIIEEKKKEFLNKLLFFTEEIEETGKLEIYPTDGKKITCGVKEAKIMIATLEDFIDKQAGKPDTRRVTIENGVLTYRKMPTSR